MTFSGIPTAALDFYEDLEADNSKSFWTEHKATYDEQVRGPVDALAAALAPEFGSPKVFRPYRDVRFARDKTPYKTHQGVWFNDAHTYFEVSAAGLRLAAGYWRTSGTQVARYRRAVADDIAGPELTRSLSRVRRAHFEVHGDQLKRVPAGYPKEHERAALLRHRTLVASREFGCPDWLSSTDAAHEIAKAWRRTASLVTWLDTHVGDDEPD